MFEVGQTIAVRGSPWRVLETREHEQPDGSSSIALVCRPARQLSEGETTVFYHPVDVAVALHAPPLAFRLDGMESEWKRFHHAFTFSLVLSRSSLASLGMSRVAIESYQISPVRAALALPRPRLLLADDVGLGKTIEAGLILMELMARGRANRVLVVTPAGLQLQWQEELADKFNIQFQRFDSSTIADLRAALPARANPWYYHSKIITSIDFLKRADIRRALDPIRFDLVIIDEAHYLSESGTAADVRRTQRSRLGAFLADRTDGLLLLTATPHNGFTEGFASLIRLCEPTLVPRGSSIERERVEPHVVRRLKSQIIKEGRPLYTPPNVTRVPLTLSPAERRLYRAVDAYARRVWRSVRGRPDRAAAGFAMTILKKRLLSSHAALRASLHTRLDTLTDDSVDVRKGQGVTGDYVAGVPLTEQQEERAQATLLSAAADPAQAGGERAELKRLIELAEAINPSDETKVARLVGFLRERLSSGPDSKVIVFTEFRDTLDALLLAVEARGFAGQVVVLHGGLDSAQRRAIERQFASPGTRILLATDAASEGINLQEHCHTVIHNELPWNPNRLEQRNGRVDRYGQRHQVDVFNLFIEDSLDDHILEVLLGKLRRIRDELGSTSNVLGVDLDIEDRLMANGGLAGENRDADIAAKKAGDALEQQVDAILNELKGQQGASLLSGSNCAPVSVADVTGPIVFADSAEIEAWIIDVLRRERSSVEQVEDEIWAIEVPLRFRRAGVDPSYPRATFHHRVAIADGNGDVAYLSPRHPLMRALLEITRAQLYDSAFASRVSYRVVEDSRPGLLVCHIARIVDASGTLVEERFLPVFAPLQGGITDDADSDLRLYLAPGDRTNAPAGVLETHFEDRFADLLSAAETEAHHRAELVAAEVTVGLEDTARRLLDDLAHWARGQEQYLKDQLLKVGQAGGQQLALVLDDSDDATRLAALRARETRLRNELDHLAREVETRRVRIEGTRRARVAGVQQLGALMIVPASMVT